MRGLSGLKTLKPGKLVIVTDGNDDWLIDRISGKIVLAAWGTSFRQIAATIPTLRLSKKLMPRGWTMKRTVLPLLKLTKDQRDWLAFSLSKKKMVGAL